MGELTSSPWPPRRDQPVQDSAQRSGLASSAPGHLLSGGGSSLPSGQGLPHCPLGPGLGYFSQWLPWSVLIPETKTPMPRSFPIFLRLLVAVLGPRPMRGTQGQARSAGTRVPAPAPGAERGQALVCLHVSARREKSCHISRTLSPEPHYSEMSLQLRTSLCRNICLRVTARGRGAGAPARRRIGAGTGRC